jgi:hypothetical protein
MGLYAARPLRLVPYLQVVRDPSQHSSLMRHNKVGLRVDRHLHVVANDAGPAPARRHRAAVGIG